MGNDWKRSNKGNALHNNRYFNWGVVIMSLNILINPRGVSATNLPILFRTGDTEFLGNFRMIGHSCSNSLSGAYFNPEACPRLYSRRVSAWATLQNGLSPLSITSPCDTT